jgi:hypothetical protein
MSARSCLATLGTSVAALALFNLTPAWGHDSPPGTLSPAALAAESEFRNALNFDASPRHIRAMNDDVEAKRWAPHYGAAFSAAERSEMGIRHSLTSLSPRVSGYFASKSEAFGGLFLDNARGTLNVLVVGDPGRAEGDLRRMSDYPERIRVAPARFSEATLDKTTADIGAELTSLRKQGIQVHHVTVDAPGNRVVVGAPSEHVAALAKRLAQYGTQVVTEPSGASSTVSHRVAESGNPMKSGLEIVTTFGTTNFVCTSAFSIYKIVPGPNPFVPATTYNGSFTAGHCGKQDQAWRHGSPESPIGTGSRPNMWQYEAETAVQPAGYPRTDSQPITLVGGNRNLVLLNSVGSYRAISSTQGADADVVGAPVCFAGRTTEVVACGTISSRNATISYVDNDLYNNAHLTIYNQRLSTPRSRPGDSGAGVYYSSQAMGIMSGVTSDGKAIYSHIDYAQRETGWTVRTG